MDVITRWADGWLWAFEARSCRFESYPAHMVNEAHVDGRQTVTLVIAGSRPVIHPRPHQPMKVWEITPGIGASSTRVMLRSGATETGGNTTPDDTEVAQERRRVVCAEVAGSNPVGIAVFLGMTENYPHGLQASR